MGTHHRLVSVLLVAALATACNRVEDHDSAVDCTTVKNPATHRLKFKLKDDGCVEKVQKEQNCDCDVEALVVRRCDTVEWKVTEKSKSIKFNKGDGSPFDWQDSGNRSGRIDGTVRGDALLEHPYNYSVFTQEACPLDPMIIVQP